MKQHIPSIITCGNLICGFAAIQIGDFYWSPILLLFSFLFDGLDGLAARALNVTSDFGRQLDSLSDVVSFGVAPAYLFYLMAPDDSLICKLVPSLIVIAGTIRLAKFNVSPPLKYFKGLPIPASAIFFIGIIMANENESEFFIEFYNSRTNYILTPLLIGILMLTFNLKMFSVKGITNKLSDNVFHLILGLLVVILAFLFKYEAISYSVVAYIILSLVYTSTFKLSKISE